MLRLLHVPAMFPQLYPPTAETRVKVRVRVRVRVSANTELVEHDTFPYVDRLSAPSFAVDSSALHSGNIAPLQQTLR